MKPLVPVVALALMASACSSMHHSQPVAALSEPAGPDTCGLQGLNSLVSMNASSIPTNLPQRIRIVQVNAPAITDMEPARVTFVSDIRNDVIQQVRCG